MAPTQPTGSSTAVTHDWAMMLENIFSQFCYPIKRCLNKIHTLCGILNETPPPPPPPKPRKVMFNLTIILYYVQKLPFHTQAFLNSILNTTQIRTS